LSLFLNLNRKYSFKPKKKRKMQRDEYDELEDSVRSLTALLGSDPSSGFQHSFEDLPPLPNQRIYLDEEDEEEEDDDEEDELANDSSDPPDLPPIATLPRDQPQSTVVTTVPFEETDDLYPIPLRARKGKDGVTALAKRKR
jgi:hypothetical protein